MPELDHKAPEGKAPDRLGKPGGMKKYRWYIIGGIGVVALLAFFIMRNKQASQSSTSGNTTQQPGIDPTTGMPYASEYGMFGGGGGMFGNGNGSQGPAGVAGPAGPRGKTGKTGKTGKQGSPGKPGARGPGGPPGRSNNPPPHRPPPRPSRHPGAQFYTVRSGDTLSGIASRFHVGGGWEGLYGLNKSVVGSNPNLIYPGQRLRL